MPFGLVGSKNREVPMANERVEQAMRVRNLTRHYGRVRHAQPATDHGEPTDHIGRRLTELPHMRYNAKKAQVEGERYHTIEYQNALLLEKMRKIMYLGTAASNNGHHETGHPDEVMPRSLNAGSRRRELRKITEQNLGIVHRIQGRASEYERRRWEGERRHTHELQIRLQNRFCDSKVFIDNAHCEKQHLRRKSATVMDRRNPVYQTLAHLPSEGGVPLHVVWIYGRRELLRPGSQSN